MSTIEHGAVSAYAAFSGESYGCAILYISSSLANMTAFKVFEPLYL